MAGTFSPSWFPLRGLLLAGEVADLAAPEVTVAVVPGPSEGLAPASLEVALVAPSSPQPASPFPSLASGGPTFSGDVVQ